MSQITVIFIATSFFMGFQMSLATYPVYYTTNCYSEMVPGMTSSKLYVLYRNKLVIIIAHSFRVLSTLMNVNR